ncbi:MAG: pitrilysin family protein [Candidatus Omnitrophota bacterium]|jgi:zinc protease
MIKKITLFSVLAFFVLGALFSAPLNAQDTIRLDNGLEAVIREDHRNPIVVFSVFIDSGSASEGAYGYAGTGISHLVEHMLFKGTKKYPAGAIEDILNKYGGNIEGYTSYDYTGYSVTILKDHLDIAIDVLKEMLTEPLFDRKELKKEMAVIEREMDMNKDDPSRRISRLTFETAFLKHPYRASPIGYKDNFERLEREDVVKFFKAVYIPENMTIAVAGDIDSRDVSGKINASFGNMPRRGIIADIRPEEPPQRGQRSAEEKADIDGAYMNISFHSTDIFSPDLYAMDILSFILGQGESSVLNENLRIKDGLVLSVTAYNYTPRDPGIFVISSVLKEENTAGTLKAVTGIIEGLKQNGVSEKDLLKAKNNFIADYIYQKETIESQANDIAQSQLMTGGPDFFKQYIENIKLVGVDDIKRAASEYLNAENMTVTVLSKSGESLKQFIPSGIAVKAAGDVKKITLSNKIPVILAENHSLPMIALTVLFKGGVRAESRDNNGISMLTSRMLMDGTSFMSRNDMAEFYETRAIAMGTYSGNNSSGITLTCLKEHIEDGLRLASDICMAASFQEDEFKREKGEVLQAIEMQDNNIVNHGHRLLKEMLFKEHPYMFQATGTSLSVNKITRDQAEVFYKNTVSPENTVIGAAGDFESGEMSGLIEKYFSRIAAGGEPRPLPPKEPPIENIRYKTAEVDKDQSLILIGFPGIDIYDKDRYAVEILSNILSSPSGVLFENLREDKGLVYAVGAFNVLGIDPGYLAVYALTSRDNIDKAKRAMLEELGMIAGNGAKKQDVEKSKNYLKAMRKVDMQTSAGFIFSAAMDELYGLGYDNYKDFDKNIDNVTMEDIKRAAKRILTPDKCAVLILRGI